MAVPSKPLVLICVTPVYGHLMPILAIGRQLIAQGYKVTFVTASHYRQRIEEIGASLVPISGYGDWTEADFESRWPIRSTLPEGLEQLAYDMEHIFINSLPSQYEAQQEALTMLKERHPDKKIVQITECVFMGTVPSMVGAPGLRPTGTLSIGIVPLCLSSIDCAPFGTGLPPDNSPSGRERNKAMNKGVQEQLLIKPQTRYKEVMKSLGANVADLAFYLDDVYTLPDRFLQMCIPSVEYPRSDAPSSIGFAGGLPKGHRDALIDHPSWWNEISSNKSKKVVAVSQGTLAVNFNDLVIPTMKGLQDRDDIIVVVALGRKGATLPADTPVPSNARVEDFIPFDDLLPHCDVFITNGGYGAFQHAISHGTPLIVAGGTEDKPEVAARAEWAGVGINLKTGQPTPEAVLGAVVEIIENPKYKKRAVELEKEMATFDPMSIIAQTIDDLAAGHHVKA